MTREEITTKITGLQTRLDAYLLREADLLAGGVKEYGIGSRNIKRYELDLANIASMIKKLEDEIEELQALLNGSPARRVIAVVERDW